MTDVFHFAGVFVKSFLSVDQLSEGMAVGYHCVY